MSISDFHSEGEPSSVSNRTIFCLNCGEITIDKSRPQKKRFCSKKCASSFYEKKRKPRDKNYLRNYQKGWIKKDRIKKRLLVLTHYSGSPPKCACCGEMEIKFLTLDHIKKGGTKERKKHGMSSYKMYLYLIKNNYPDGFQVLCYNCNCAKGHYGTCPHVENKR